MSARGDRVAVGPWLEETRKWADRALEEALDDLGEAPPRLAGVVRYALLGPGKRLRPVLVRLLSSHFGGSDAAARLPAAAVECVHAYSLVHDDLPSMDDDDLRRGRPTCHKVFGEARAILAGDALLTHAFFLLARTGEHAADLARVLAEGAGASGMVGGQVQDLDSQASDFDARLVEEIHSKKTAALFAAAAEMGAIAAGAERSSREAARAYGFALGRCFQATDDILDVTGDATTLGKTPGKDARGKKPTLVAALGLEAARAAAESLAAACREKAARLPAREGDLAFQIVDHVLARRA